MKENSKTIRQKNLRSLAYPIHDACKVIKGKTGKIQIGVL